MRPYDMQQHHHLDISTSSGSNQRLRSGKHGRDWLRMVDAKQSAVLQAVGNELGGYRAIPGIYQNQLTNIKVIIDLTSLVG